MDDDEYVLQLWKSHGNNGNPWEYNTISIIVGRLYIYIGNPFNYHYNGNSGSKWEYNTISKTHNTMNIDTQWK